MCAKCAHKLQSRWSGPQRAEHRAEIPQPLGGGKRGGVPLFVHTVEVLGACAAIMVALGYGLATGTWWPVFVACALALGLLVLRR